MHSYQPCAPPHKRLKGFSLVEIMFVVVIIGLLAMLAMPAFQKVRRNAQSNRFVSDLRTFAQEFESHSLQNGSWPPSAAAGVVPTGMDGDLRREVWSIPNSLGGTWSWDFDPAAGTAKIVSAGVTASANQRIQIDARIDDGDPSGGLLRDESGQLVYYLQR